MLKKLMEAVSREINTAARNPFPLGNFPISPSETMKFAHRSIYEAQGKSAAHLIEATAGLAGIVVTSILDFPSGHGRVMRAFRANWPNARLVACDVDRAGVKFCAETFGAQPVYSRADLSEVSIGDPVDVVWIGSLLTHLDAGLWPSVFRFAERSLREGGFLLATYASSYVAELVRSGDHSHINVTEAVRGVADFHRMGFGFMQYETHKIKYGRTLASFKWVSDFVSTQKNFRPVVHFERGWAGRQSVLGLVKDTLFALIR